MEQEWRKCWQGGVGGKVGEGELPSGLWQLLCTFQAA